MARPEEIQARLMELFQDKLQIAVPSADTDLMAAGLIDSLVVVELLVLLENEFGVTISMEALELDTLRSVRSIAAYLETLEQAPDRQAA